MPDVTSLGSIPNVELARTGSWALSTGQWTPTPADFAAAVAALNCPAVRPPRIRLGHTDPRFDGEPAIGSVANLRVEAGGHSLVGDLVGLPSWLPQVISAAYPDRSVEGVYDGTCAVGHRHPFILTGLALLGVTAPGVGTLRSIGDVGALYGVEREPVAAGRAVSATYAGGDPGEIAAARDDNALMNYWLTEGAHRWTKDRHPWSKLVSLLKRHVDPERAKRIASTLYHKFFGHWPGERRGKNKTGPG